MRVLVVEDDAVLGNLLKGYLTQAGKHDVWHVKRGDDALRLLKEEKFDCAFVDLQLPDMSGIDVLRVLKRADATLPVIMMSGYLTLEKSVEAMRIGASDFLAKPFSFQHLMMSLERAIKERQMLLDNIALKLELEARKELERLNRELERNLEDQKRLFTISRTFDDVKTSDELYRLLVQWSLHLTRSRETGFFILLPSQDALFAVARTSENGEEDYLLPKVINLFPVTVGGLSYGVVLPQLSYQGSGADGNSLLSHIEAELRLSPGMLRIWPLEIRKEFFGFVLAISDHAAGDISEADSQTFEFLLKKASLAIENLALYESLMANFYGILRSLVNALEAKDLYTGKHSERVTRLAVRIAKAMSRPAEEIEALNTVGYLHDIGKIGVPDHILNKPARLSDEEFALIAKHPSMGEDIVKDLGLSDTERSIIRHHHERWDGHGYPDRIGGEDIPLITRIVTLADAYDAMTTDRAYRKAMDKDYVWRELAHHRGTQFDPQVVDAFLDTFFKGHGKR